MKRWKDEIAAWILWRRWIKSSSTLSIWGLRITNSPCLTLMTWSLGRRLQSAKVSRLPSRKLLLEMVMVSAEVWSISSGRGEFRYSSSLWNSRSRFFSWTECLGGKKTKQCHWVPVMSAFWMIETGQTYRRYLDCSWWTQRTLQKCRPPRQRTLCLLGSDEDTCRKEREERRGLEVKRLVSKEKRIITKALKPKSDSYLWPYLGGASTCSRNSSILMKSVLSVPL